MDYKYIEQLLERFWACETSLEEEQILKTFFSQDRLPEGLARYKSLFVYEKEQARQGLGKDFDQRVLEALGQTEAETETPQKVVKVQRFTLSRRLRPLYRAAAAVAVVSLLGISAGRSFEQADPASQQNGAWDYNQQAYKDSYQDPQKAYEEGMKALNLFKQGPKTAAADSAVLNAQPQEQKLR